MSAVARVRSRSRRRAIGRLAAAAAPGYLVHIDVFGHRRPRPGR